MTESHYSSNMMSSPTKSVSSVKSYTKKVGIKLLAEQDWTLNFKKRRRSSAAKKEIEFVRSVSSGSSGIESMSSLDGHSTSSRRSSSSKEGSNLWRPHPIKINLFLWKNRTFLILKQQFTFKPTKAWRVRPANSQILSSASADNLYSML